MSQSLTAQRGAIPITLDRPRIFFFSMAATWLLVQEYGVDFAGELYTLAKTSGEDVQLRLKSLDALAFFLWAGLQEDLAGTGETLTIEQAREFIRPWLLKEIFNKLILALTGAVSIPVDPSGKAAAAGTTPQPSAKKTRALNKMGKKSGQKVSTLKTRSGLRLER